MMPVAPPSNARGRRQQIGKLGFLGQLLGESRQTEPLLQPLDRLAEVVDELGHLARDLRGQEQAQGDQAGHGEEQDQRQCEAIRESAEVGNAIGRRAQQGREQDGGEQEQQDVGREPEQAREQEQGERDRCRFDDPPAKIACVPGYPAPGERRVARDLIIVAWSGVCHGSLRSTKTGVEAKPRRPACPARGERPPAGRSSRRERQVQLPQKTARSTANRRSMSASLL